MSRAARAATQCGSLSRGFEVTAIDFSQVAIDKARQLTDANGVRIEWQVGDVTVSMPDGPFDLVAVLYLHVPRGEFAALMEAGCRALARGWDLARRRAPRRQPRRWVRRAAGSRRPSRSSLIAGQLAADPTMSIVTAARVGRPVVVDDEHRVALDSLVRATRSAATDTAFPTRGSVRDTGRMPTHLSPAIERSDGCEEAFAGARGGDARRCAGERRRGPDRGCAGRPEDQRCLLDLEEPRARFQRHGRPVPPVDAERAGVQRRPGRRRVRRR